MFKLIIVLYEIRLRLGIAITCPLVKRANQYSHTFTPLEGASTAVILFDVPFCLYFIKHIIEWIQYTRLRSSVCSKVPKVWIPCQIVRYPGPLFYAIASCRSRVPLIASFVLLMVMRPPLASHITYSLDIICSSDTNPISYPKSGILSCSTPGLSLQGRIHTNSGQLCMLHVYGMRLGGQEVSLAVWCRNVSKWFQIVVCRANI
jgi:hypothetical protein